jgi:hypothetical protein
MKCRDFELIVPDLARHRSDELARERALAHAEGCDRCATRLVHEQALSDGVRAVIAAIANNEPSPRVETALLAAFNTHFAQKASSTFSSTLLSRRPRLFFSLAFVFAILLILISIPPIYWLRSRSLTGVPEVISQQHSAGSVASLSADRGADVKTRPGAGTSRRQKSRRPLVVNYPNVTETKAPEEVTEFLPLADGEDLTLLEAAQVVRVELPVSALMDLGLRVGPEISPGQVKADILLGHDGSARAIRFVR